MNKKWYFYLLFLSLIIIPAQCMEKQDQTKNSGITDNEEEYQDYLGNRDAEILEYYRNRLSANGVSEIQIELFLAVEDENIKKINWLIEHGADPNYKYPEHDQWYLLDNAVMTQNLLLVQFLVEAGAVTDYKNDPHEVWIVCDPFLTAISLENMEIASYLIHKGANINVQDTDGWSMLHYGVFLKNKEIIAFLIDNGIDCTIKTFPESYCPDMTALQYAKYKGFDEMYEYLLALGVKE